MLHKKYQNLCNFQVLTFDNLDTFPNFENIDNFDLNLNKSWIYMEIFWDLGLLLLSPPGAAPLRQSRCSVKAELSSSSSIFQPEHFPVQTGFANCVWRSNTLWVETEIQNYKYDLEDSLQIAQVSVNFFHQKS